MSQLDIASIASVDNHTSILGTEPELSALDCTGMTPVDTVGSLVDIASTDSLDNHTSILDTVTGGCYIDSPHPGSRVDPAAGNYQSPRHLLANTCQYSYLVLEEKMLDIEGCL